MLRSTIGMIAILMLTYGVEAAPLTVQVEGANPGQGPVLVGICSGSLDFGSCRYSQNVQPPTADWGTMLSEGQLVLLTSPHVALAAGLAIVLAVLGFNLLGDGLRDVLDPRQAQR